MRDSIAAQQAPAATSPPPSAAIAAPVEPKVGEMMRRTLVRLIVLIIVFVLVEAAVQFVFGYVSHFPYLGGAPSYLPYAQIPLALLFSVLIVMEFAQLIYWNLRLKLAHAEAASARSVFRIIGIVAAIVVVVGAYISPTSAAGLGAFAGLVVGFATQQVMGQAIAGIFLSITRPFKAGDKVNVASQDGTVNEVTSLFTVLDTPDTKVLIPNSGVISQVIKVTKPTATQKS